MFCARKAYLKDLSADCCPISFSHVAPVEIKVGEGILVGERQRLDIVSCDQDSRIYFWLRPLESNGHKC